MRDRLIDAVLLIALAAAAAAVGWTLLSLGRSPAQVPAAAPGVEGEARAGAEILPLAPNGDSSRAPLLPVDPDVAANPAPVSEAQPDPVASAPVQDAPLPADGPVQLERIGFSFTTGGTGACGLVLEPWRHVAVSRELLAAYGCGAEVRIVLDDPKAGRRELSAVIGDTMNPVHSRTVNIYVGQDEPALEYGVTAGLLEP